MGGSRSRLGGGYLSLMTPVALTERLRDGSPPARMRLPARRSSQIGRGWVADSPAIRPHSAGSWSIFSRSMRGMSGTWMWYAS